MCTLGIGVVAALSAAIWMVSRLGERPERPEASGQVGVLSVYAQTPGGPVRLRPDQGGAFPRPQDIAFQFSAEGTGPRFVRVELEMGADRWVVYEELHMAPAFRESLPRVVRLDERHPDRVVLTVVVEAPHHMSAVSRFPLRLVGPNSRFWQRGGGAARPD